MEWLTCIIVQYKLPKVTKSIYWLQKSFVLNSLLIDNITFVGTRKQGTNSCCFSKLQ